MTSMNYGIFIFSMVLGLAGCKGSESSNGSTSEDLIDSTENISETGMGIASNMATASEGGSFFTLASGMLSKPDTEGTEYGPFSTCSLASARSKSCGGSPATSTIDWNSCAVGTATLTGGWLETWSTTGTCSAGTLANSANVTRTTTTNGSTMTFASGATIVTKSNSHSTYDNTTVGGGVSVAQASGTRTMSITGIHRQMYGPKGRQWFDHSIITTAPLSISGSKASGTRQIASGTLKIYHNLAQYTATLTFSNVLWGDSACCYPTSGSITGSLAGSVSGSTTLAFTSTCGTANFADTDSSTTQVTLRQCD